MDETWREVSSDVPWGSTIALFPSPCLSWWLITQMGTGGRVIKFGGNLKLGAMVSE